MRATQRRSRCLQRWSPSSHPCWMDIMSVSSRTDRQVRLCGVCVCVMCVCVLVCTACRCDIHVSVYVQKYVVHHLCVWRLVSIYMRACACYFSPYSTSPTPQPACMHARALILSHIYNTTHTHPLSLPPLLAPSLLPAGSQEVERPTPCKGPRTTLV